MENLVKLPNIAANSRAVSAQEALAKTPGGNVNGTRQAFTSLWKNKKITIPTGVVLIAGIVVSVVFLLTSTSGPKPITYANLSPNFRVCLLSTTNDAADAGRLWPAVQAATGKAAINAEHITAPAGTSDTLVPYLNSLIAMHCGLIISAGEDLTQPTITVAKTHPQQHFLAPQPDETLSNVTPIPQQPEALTTTVVAAAQAGTTAPH
jgi:hypothetical protein